MTANSQPRSPRSQSDCSDVDLPGARYLFAIATLSTGGNDRVSTGQLREYLNVAAASATGMITKLDDRGLADHEKYRGVTLTSAGESVVEQLGWRTCVVATFFESVLDTALDEWTAFEVAYTLPEDGLDGLRELAGSTCLGRCPEVGGDVDKCVA